MPPIYTESLEKHIQYQGKLTMESKVPLGDKHDLSTYYSPGVAAPCLEIAKDPTTASRYTRTSNTIAVVSDGSAVLGLGKIGGLASLPVMEGKAILFKQFGGVDAVPIILDTHDTEEIIKTIEHIAPTFGGINLEDFAAPQCFEIEERLQAKLNIPVFHDDQHGTAIVVLAGLINALKVAKKDIADIKIVLSGPGAAGIPIVKLLALYGAKHIVAVDSKGILSSQRTDLNKYKQSIIYLNRDDISGGWDEALVGADVFIGVTGQKNELSVERIKSMNPDHIVFALSNPDPEVDYDLAKQAGALVVATGRSDKPNQLNNVLVFPGVFRGLLDGGIPQVTDTHKLAAAVALAEMVSDPTPDYIIPDAFHPEVSTVVAQAVKKVG